MLVPDKIYYHGHNIPDCHILYKLKGMIEYSYEGLRIIQLTGSELAAREGLALSLWEAASADSRASILWDVPGTCRKEAFLAAIRAAPLCAFAKKDGAGIACCWLSPLSLGPARAACMHFFPAMAAPKTWRQAGRALLEFERSRFREYASLLAFTPCLWLPTARLLCGLDFKLLAVLPDACFLADYQMLMDGALWCYKRHGESCNE